MSALESMRSLLTMILCVFALVAMFIFAAGVEIATALIIFSILLGGATFLTIAYHVFKKKL